MKAWLAENTHTDTATVVFAETRGKARSIAIETDACEDLDFCDIYIRRLPHMDKYYEEGKKEMDWYDEKDRIALVKDCSFRCADVDMDWCEDCSAKQYCGLYEEYIEESEDTE